MITISVSKLCISGISTAIGFSIGNFVYACFGSKDYSTAQERSFFGTLAIATSIIVLVIA